MDLAAPHSGFVIAAYVLSAALIAGLVLYVTARDRTLRSEAGKLERRMDGDDGRS